MTNMIMGAFVALMLVLAALAISMFTVPVSQSEMANATALSRKGPLTLSAFRDAMSDGKMTEIEMNQVRHTAEASGEIYR